MFTSFDEKEFWGRIEEKDFRGLKINTVSAIRNDPTFARDETARVLEILEERVPEIFEEEIDLGYEERLDKSEWDKGYFTKLTYWFQKNFAKSRLAHIKEVGRAVHQDTQETYLRSMGVRSGSDTTPSKTDAGHSEAGNPTQAPEKKKNRLHIVIAIGAAVLVLIVMLLLWLLVK